MSSWLWMLGAILNAWVADHRFKRGDHAYGALCCVIALACVWFWFCEVRQ